MSKSSCKMTSACAAARPGRGRREYRGSNFLQKILGKFRARCSNECMRLQARSVEDARDGQIAPGNTFRGAGTWPGHPQLASRRCNGRQLPASFGQIFANSAVDISRAPWAQSPQSVLTRRLVNSITGNQPADVKHGRFKAEMASTPRWCWDATRCEPVISALAFARSHVQERHTPCQQ
jgi:hypothetical protein